MPRHKYKARYKHQPLSAASTFQRELKRGIEDLKTLGAFIELREFDGTPGQRQLPHLFQATGEDLYTNAELAEGEMLFLVVKGLGKDGKLVGRNVVAKDYYLETVRKGDRQGGEDILNAVDVILGPARAFVAAHPSQQKKA